jgi:L-fuconate dehydratase
VKVSTGEAVANRIVFKQLLQAEAIDVVQIDSTRWRRENLATLSAPLHTVCRSRRCGLCELVQHFSFLLRRRQRHRNNHMISSWTTSTSTDPVRIDRGRYLVRACPVRRDLRIAALDLPRRRAGSDRQPRLCHAGVAN